jgi:hypothetical protein
MKIPRRFQLANRTWRVEYKNLRKEIGRTSFHKAVIYLDKSLRRNPEVLYHTFIHELLHATSGTMGWKRVNNDEDRIDVLAAMLAQALTTAR